jgi:hypothetical protein
MALLAANPLSLLEELAVPDTNATLDWRVWVILVADLVLAAAGILLLKGWLIYGRSEQETEQMLKAWCEKQGWLCDSQSTPRKTLWGGNRVATCVQITRESQVLTLWLIGQGDETRLEGETPAARALLRTILPELGRVEKPYLLQDHLTGVLYIVLAIILAVLAWIFFFEPRLILID